jgi:Flp pilus assembly protein TadB
MNIWLWFAAAGLGLAAALLPAPVSRLPGTAATVEDRGDSDGWMMRWRPLLALLAAGAAYSFVGGTAGAVLAAPAGAVCWLVIGRVEPAEVRREREAAKAELPALVRLLSAALSSGAAPAEALVAVAAALPVGVVGIGLVVWDLLLCKLLSKWCRLSSFL